MILKNGKFYDGDKEVPLEFGNWTQIKLLENHKALLSGVFVPEKFNCECGTLVERIDPEKDHNVSCAGCSNVYRWYWTTSYGIPIPCVKLKP
jgi:hypothetical protein